MEYRKRIKELLAVLYLILHDNKKCLHQNLKELIDICNKATDISSEYLSDEELIDILSNYYNTHIYEKTQNSGEKA